MQVVAARGRTAAGQVLSSRERRPTRICARVHDAEHIESIARRARPRGDARRRHVHVAGVRRGRPAGGRRGADRRRSCAGRRAGHAGRSRWCGRPGITPKPIARWGSASTTTLPSARACGARPRARPRRHRRLRRAPRQRHAVDASMRIRAVLFVSSHQYPFYPGTGAATETGRGDGAGLHRQPAARGGRDATPTSTWSTARRSCRSLQRVRAAS